MKNKKYTHISWKKFDTLVKELAEKIKGNFDGIYGIPRGGLPIAVFLSHHLNIPLLEKPTKNSLIVDDISDNGTTLTPFTHNKIACLFSTPWTKVKPDWFIATKENKEEWLIYPWEKDPKE